MKPAVPAVAGLDSASMAPSSTAESVSGASRRLRALAALSGSLTDALTPESAADLVSRRHSPHSVRPVQWS